jgi:hypothetical protein
MTPSQLLPPVKPSEAVAIAELLLKLTQGRPWSNDIRAKLSGALPTLHLEKLTVSPLTLTPDPTHPATYFLLIQTLDDPWLLHIAPASAATTPLFPKPLLLSRVRPAGEREIIINAIPVADNLGTIIQGLYPNLLARATSLHNLQSYPINSSLKDILKSFPKRPNLLPAIRTTESSWQPYLPILLSNWREGFVSILEKQITPPNASEAEPFSRFSQLVQDPANPRTIASFYNTLQSNVKHSFDFELDLSQHPNLDIDQLHTLLDNLKLLGVSIQSVELSSHLHLPAFAMLLQSRQIGLTSDTEQSISGLRTHWKVADEPQPHHN